MIMRDQVGLQVSAFMARWHRVPGKPNITNRRLGLICCPGKKKRTHHGTQSLGPLSTQTLKSVMATPRTAKSRQIFDSSLHTHLTSKYRTVRIFHVSSGPKRHGTHTHKRKQKKLDLLLTSFALYLLLIGSNRLLKGCRVKAETGLSVAGEQDCPGGMGTEPLRFHQT